ncbi:hypothetical protein M3629_25005 [Paenibacillus polysaccharolyticus]|uniref:hypothetical protein n=1 Tax=Paenibacillus polysaccharolyticus TaxID=582692 RepID=UPI00203B92E1|nr:hypothetical protein [Paenibacillus polysaccharolyticus]MCM3136035.1 hypothetical protein [Paenibacillus polysaccharolyticus]
MNPISSATKNSFTPANPTSNRDKEIQGLMQQKVKLNEQIQVVQSNDELDIKTKAERIKSLTSSIGQVDSRIAQIKAEEMEEKNKVKQNQQASQQQSKPEEQPQTPSMNHLIKHSQTYDQLGKLVGLREKMQNSIHTIEGETRFDRIVLENDTHSDLGKTQMLENAERTVFQKKREVVQDLESHISKTNHKLGELADEIYKPGRHNAGQLPSSIASSKEDSQEIDRGKSAVSKLKDGTADNETAGQGRVSNSVPSNASASASSAYFSVDIRI